MPIKKTVPRRPRSWAAPGVHRRNLISCVIGFLFVLASIAEPTAQPTTAPTSQPTANQPPIDDSEPTPLVDWGASFFTRYELRHGAEVGIQDSLPYRARLAIALSWDRVAIEFAPQAAGVMGLYGGDDLADAELGLHLGSVALLGGQGDTWRLQAGRFAMHYGDGRVIGREDWDPVGRAFDGVRFQFFERWYYFVDAFFTIIDEGALTQSSSPPDNRLGHGDLYFTGIVAGLDRAQTPINSFDLLILSRIWPALDGGRETAAELTVGLRDNSIKFAPMYYTADVGVQFGSRPDTALPTALVRDVLAWQIEFEVGLMIPESGGFGLGAIGLYASGDDTSDSARDNRYDPLFPSHHDHLGATDVIGPRTDVTATALRLRWERPEQLRIHLDGWAFWWAQTPNAGTSDSRFRGGEVDLALGYELAPGLELEASYGVFVEGMDGNLTHFAELGLRFDRALGAPW